MKVIIIALIIIVSITISCKDSNYEKYLEFSELYILNINEIENRTNYIKDKIELEMFESPIATKKWFNKSNLTTEHCNKVKTLIDSLIKSKLTSLSKKDIHHLQKKVLILQDSLINLIEHEKDFKILEKSLKKIFSALETEEIAIFNSKKISKDGLLSVLLKLRLDVCYSELSTISSIYTNVGSSGGSWYPMKPMIIPRSKTIKAGQSFEAEIYYSIFDTFIDLTYEIDEKQYKPAEGVLKFEHKVTEDSGTVTIPGTLIINSRRTGLDYKLPFEIKYNVLPN